MWQMNPSLVKRKGQVKDNENDEEQRKEPKRAKGACEPLVILLTHPHSFLVELALESAAGTDDAKKKTAVAPKQKGIQRAHSFYVSD
jgi:hypothetical protein